MTETNADKPTTLNEGRYTLVRQLGVGGMAEVYECYDHRLDVWRAAKLLLPELTARPSVRRRFDVEAHAMARLEHKHVLRVYDVGEENGQPFMVMELARGGSLDTYVVRHGKMHPRLAVEVMLEVCEGIAAAHDDGIIHRDIKPENVLVDRRGNCKVTDFGIAQITNDERSRTRTGSVMGTLGYMAPEQRKDAKNVSPAVDVYALGATLFDLVTGEEPHDLFMAHHKPELLEKVPENLRPFILGAVAHEPEDRLSVQAFVQGLQAVLPSLPDKPDDLPPLVTDRSPSLIPPPRRSSNDSEPTVYPDKDTPPPAERAPAPPPSAAAAPPEPPPAPAFDDDEDSASFSGDSSSWSYLDQESIAQERRSMIAKVREKSRKRESQTTGIDEDEAPPSSGRSGRAVGGVLGAGFTLAIAAGVAGAVLLAAGVGYGAVQVRGTEATARAADARLVASIEDEVAIIEELAGLGGSEGVGPLEEQLAALRAAPAPERPALAEAFVRQAAAMDDHHGGKDETIHARVTRLEAALDARSRNHDAWQVASDGVLGQAACAVGMATCR